VEYRLSARAEGTGVTIVQSNNRDDAEAEESAKLWDLVLNNLKEYLER
jgi:hypothetical protein